MKKASFVLRALNILGPEDILKLAQEHQAKQMPMKKAVGEEMVFWDEHPEEKPEGPSPEAIVLPFQKKRDFLREEMAPPAKEEKGTGPNILATEVLLWQREMTRESEDSIQKLDAFKGYKKSADMYVVKTQTLDGKEKIRFASTNGILVNKKQA